MKILIAEDSRSYRTFLAKVVTNWGFDPVVVDDGQAALQAMQCDDAPRMLLLGWDMPNISGIDVCEHIRMRQDSDPPYIILLTSRGEIRHIMEGLNKGANDYIFTPFDNTELQVRLMAGKRMLEMQAELNAAKNILTEERDIIEDILCKMRYNSKFDQTNLRYLQAPVQKTSGDVLFSAYCPDNTQHVMLGDFTGHGLTASLGGPIASDVFYSMTAKGLSMPFIVREINQHLFNKMPTSLFLGAILIEVNPERNNMRVWNCGMEEVLVFKKDSLKRTISSGNLALGIIDEPVLGHVAVDIEPGDRLYAYSDGVTETVNRESEMFGRQRLASSISDMLSNNDGIEVLEEEIKTFRGAGDQLDDIILLELLC